ncbi:YciI family protein [Aquabacter cavernae]|uniref:YciI family protein n=1 Tax=Aquabacter cavernae TaxID=2496029 RepID=UPI000F8DFE6B|nr:YciI family protein [Aquabacter cavernae]
MLFVVLKKDKPNHEHVRAEARPAHLEFLNANADKVAIGGPLVTEDGSRMIGSMLVVEAQSAAEAKALLENDPFAKAGLFESVEVLPWKWVFKNPNA